MSSSRLHGPRRLHCVVDIRHQKVAATCAQKHGRLFSVVHLDSGEFLGISHPEHERAYLIWSILLDILQVLVRRAARNFYKSLLK